MDDNLLKERTRQFAVRAIGLVRALPKRPEARVLGEQLLRSATSVGANYRSACRARSESEFAARMGVVEEEADESAYWQDLIVQAGLMKRALIGALLQEAQELTRTASASARTARRRCSHSEIRNPKSEMGTGHAA